MARMERTQPSVLDAGTATYQIAIGDADLTCLFIHLLRCRPVFLEAKTLLTPGLFDRVREPHWAILWATMLDLDSQFGEWTYESLTHAISVRQRQDPSAMPDPYWDALMRADDQGIVFSTFCARAEDLMPDYARELLRKYLHERTVVQPLSRHLRSQGDAYAQNFVQLVAEASARIMRIEAVRQAPIGDAMPTFGSILPPPVLKRPTGITYIDRHIVGQRRGDCNGILGIRGAGKTTLGMHMALQHAKKCYDAALRGEPAELSVFTSYEEPESKLQRRAWSNAAEISWDTLDQMTDWEQLSTGLSLKPYEQWRRNNADSGGIVLGERERYESAIQWVNRHFVFLDMSGSERFPNAGRGGVPEIVSALNRLQEERQMKISQVVFDYAGLIVRRSMADRGISPDAIRHELGPFGDRIRQEVSIRYDCTSWVLHQMSSDQGKRGPTTLLTDLDAAEAHNFGENMAAVACLGSADPATKCQLLNWSKARYVDRLNCPPSVVMLNGLFYRFDDVSDRYQPDSVTRSFINPAEAEMINGAQHEGPVGTPVGLGRTGGNSAGADMEI